MTINVSSFSVIPLHKEQLKMNPAIRGIKIIALTFFVMKGDRDKIMQAGFDDHSAVASALIER